MSRLALCSLYGLREGAGGRRTVSGMFRFAVCMKRRVSLQIKNFDYFTTTLSVSPLKNAALLNAVGEEASKLYGVRYLPSDFKKRGRLSDIGAAFKKYGLYRQDYCGCIFSKRRVLRQEDNKNEIFISGTAFTDCRRTHAYLSGKNCGKGHPLQSGIFMDLRCHG